MIRGFQTLGLLVAAAALSAAPAAAQTITSNPINATTATVYAYPEVAYADSPPAFVAAFPKPLLVTTSTDGAFIATFSSHCDLASGVYAYGGQMLIHLEVDGAQVLPGEIETYRVGSGGNFGGICSYTWMVPKVVAGRHQVQVWFRIFSGYNGGFARVENSTLSVLHAK